MIRKAENKDYEELIKLVYQVHKLHCENRPDIYVDGNPFPKNYFDNMFNDEKSLILVFEEDKKIVGLLTASIKHNNPISIAKSRTVYFIEDIVVDNNYRRKGIGKQLYNYLEEKAIKEGIDAIELNVWAFNKTALEFYQSLGMSVKNLKLEKQLNSTDVEIDKLNLNITNKVK